MISINNKNAILLRYFLWISLLFLPVSAAALYFYQSEILIICIFLLFVIGIVRFMFTGYVEITAYHEYIAVKEYRISGGKNARSFTPIALEDIREFYIRENTLVFHTEFESKVRNTSFSVKYFTEKQKNELITALTELIRKSKAA
ncbi:hypothetical protein JET18_11875 [Chryseobacterium sp. L7]|uniref:PH domain-containing protein n=1 Tax=Chryseobacterium endalhagicum TaxID=2797638 RepID=A0ABS1QG07_9FLAO|nr:hypothetical protein [Chryseobacterium endalhagicum]MBL1221543.1 hypothetical protein [Chryseobacterium endalhagicum]